MARVRYVQYIFESDNFIDKFYIVHLYVLFEGRVRTVFEQVEVKVVIPIQTRHGLQHARFAQHVA